MNTKTNHTVESLNELTLAVITKINNHFANMVGAKETKRFGTKPAAIKKCLLNQAEFNITFPPKKVEEKVVFTPSDTKRVLSCPTGSPVKVAPKSSFDMKATLTSNDSTAKEGSIEWLIIEAITHAGIVEDVIARIVGNYSRPRSEKNVDQSFAIRKIKRLIKKGKVTLTK